MIAVVTFLWSDPTYRWNHLFTYRAEHVEKLFASIDRHLSLPHENVLVTDVGHLADSWAHVDRVVPMWDDHRNLPGWRGKGRGCYPRLKAFDPDVGQQLAGDAEHFVWFDLDCVITGDLDPLFEDVPSFKAWRDANPPTPYCGSMIAMRPGARTRVWTLFNRNPHDAIARARHYIGTDQAWIGHCLGLNEATWGTEDGVYNFRHDLVRQSSDVHEIALPDNARLVFFTGPVDPSQKETQEQCPWISEHWRI